MNSSKLKFTLKTQEEHEEVLGKKSMRMKNDEIKFKCLRTFPVGKSNMTHEIEDNFQMNF